MEKWKNLKRFLSVVLSISMVVGLMAVVEPRKVEASGENITWEFKSFSGSGELRCTHSDYPSDVADYYSVKAYVDGSVTATTTYLETQYPWDGTNDTVIQGLSASESVYIPAGTILQEYSTATWSEVSGGKTLVLSNALYIVNDNGVWKEADSNALSLSFGTVDGNGHWYLTPSAVPSYEKYYQFSSVQIDGTWHDDVVWLEFCDANKVAIYSNAGFADAGNTPDESFYIPKGTVLYGKGTNPWGENTGNDLIVTEDLYVEYINGTWQVTAWYPQDHTTMENGGYNMPERAINLISNGDFNSGITNSNCIGNSSVSNKMLSMDITGTDDYFQIYGISLTKGVTYKLTYYMWVSDASNLQYNMYADGAASPAGSWKDFVLTSSISENTEGWQKVEVEWTAPETGEAVFGFKNYNATGSAKIWIDDIALYDTAIPEPVEIEVGFDWISGAIIAFTSDLGNEALADIYGSSCDATGSIVVDGQTYTVTYTLSNGQLVIWELPNAYGNASNIQIQEGMELVFPSSSSPLTIKNTLTLGKNAAGDWYVSDVIEHTQLGGNPLPEGKTNLVEGGELNSKITNSDLVNNAEVVEGMARIDVTGTDDYMQIYGIPVTAQHTYKISYYIWINGANSLKYNMFAANGTAWEDWILGTDGSLTSDTGEWKKVDFEWTASQTAELVIGFKNYDANGTAQIYLDDIVVYDSTKNTTTDITISKAYPISGDSWCLEVDDIAKATASYYSATIKVDDAERKVAIGLSDGKLVIWKDFFSVYDQAATVPNESFVIPNDTVLYPVDPDTTGWESEIEAARLNVTQTVEVYKVGSGWGTYSEEHDTSATPIYYCIDNNMSYMVASSAGVYEIIKDGTENITTRTLTEIGTYDITRIEQDIKFVQKVVLYKSGDAHTDTEYEITASDLVAVKWAALDENDNTLGEQFAADVNQSGTVDGFDAKAMRKALVSDSPNTYFTKVKGNTSLNGEMPIIGFDGPDVEFLEEKNAETIYSMIKDLGINTVLLNRVEVGTNYAWSSSQLSVAEKYGLKLYLNDGYINDESNVDGIGSSLGDSAKTKVSNITSKYDGYSSFGGYFIEDEPMYNAVYNSKKPIDNFDVPLTSLKGYTNIHSYLNLAPYIAGQINKQLGGSSSAPMTYQNYKTYVDASSTAGVEALSYDMYLRGNGITTGAWFWESTSYKIHTEDFWTNLDWMSTIAKADSNNNPFYAFVQVGNDFSDENKNATATANLTTIQEMYFEANAALAMGAKGINYYSLIQPKEYVTSEDNSTDYTRSGLINYLGQANNGGSHGDNYQYYNAAKKINAYIKAVDEVLMNATSEAVITTNSTVAGYLGSEVSSYGSIASINNTEVIVGCFDYYGQEAFMVVNITPDAGNSGSSQNVTLTFNGAQSGQYIGMNDTDWQTLNSSSTLTLDILAGEAVVIVLD